MMTRFRLCAHTYRAREVDFEDAGESFSVEGKVIAVTTNTKIADTDWASLGIDVVCCCTVWSRFRSCVEW